MNNTLLLYLILICCSIPAVTALGRRLGKKQQRGKEEKPKSKDPSPPE